MDARRFLRDYWQKRPLLIRAAFPADRLPCNRADLFALARNPHVESRLVLERAGDRKSTRLNSSHIQKSRMPSSA